ncbi:retrovirus-related pol polyprotein from transposon TNT 1-94 [Tanacetum coccineum]
MSRTDLKAQLQDKDIAISELKKLIEKIKGKYVETKFGKSSVIRQPNAFKSKRQSILGKPATFSDSIAKKDFSKPVTAQILSQNVKPDSKNTNVIAPRMSNDNLNAKTSHVNFICVTFSKCVLNDNHDICVLHFINGVNSRTKMPIFVPISTREPKRTVNQSAATPLKRIVAAKSINQKPRSKHRKQYEQISKTCKWWYSKFTPPGYQWKPKSSALNVKPNVSLPLGKKSRNANILKSNTIRRSTLSNIHCLLILLQLIEIIIFIIDYGCSKHMMGNLKLLSNFVEKFLGTVKFGNDQIAPILGYGDLVQGNVTIKRVYYVEGLNHNLFSDGQFCDADLEVAVRKSTCCIHDLKGNDLLTGTEFLNTTLHAYFAKEGIEHETSTARTPEQNGVVKRRNHTLVEVARTILSTAIVPLFFWAEAITTTWFIQNRSLVIPRHKKTPYHIINGQKSSVKFFHIFGSLCYIVRDGHNLDKMKEKGDACIFVGYSTQSRAYRVYNKRTRVIVESIHVNFDKLPQMASDHVSSDPVSTMPDYST